MAVSAATARERRGRVGTQRLEVVEVTAAARREPRLTRRTCLAGLLKRE